MNVVQVFRKLITLLFMILMNVLSFSLSSYVFNIGFFFAWLSGDNVQSHVEWYGNAILFGIIIGLFNGFIVGAIHWIIIFQTVSIQKSLIWRTAIGFSIWYAILYGLYIFLWHNPIIDTQNISFEVQNKIMMLIASVSGIAVIILQWSIFSKKFRYAIVWILTNWIGLAMSAIAILIFDPDDVGATKIGAISGIVTGIILLLLLNFEEPKQEKSIWR